MGMDRHDWQDTPPEHRTVIASEVEATDFRQMCPGDTITILLPGGLRAVQVQCIPGGYYPRPLRRSGGNAAWAVEQRAWPPLPMNSLPELMAYLTAEMAGTGTVKEAALR
jgi:hypothetical protein